ncbi:hypothetical protein J6Q66_02260 [bacterium]|nr:hypothetical protein [bacterium]
MSVAPTQCHLLSIISRKADLEYRLLNIMNDISRLSCQSAALNEEMLAEMQSVYNFQSVLTDENTKDMAEKIEAFNSNEFYVAYQTQMAMINSKEKLLNAEKQQIETQLNALNTLEEGVNKQLENDLKKSVLQV